MRRLELVVGDDDDRYLVAQLDLGDALAFFVEQKIGDGGGRLYQHLAGAFLHRLFLDQTQYRQR